MKQSIAQVAIVVREYDEAIEFYVNTLGFNLVEDTYIPAQSKRWVVVAPANSTECRLLLARVRIPAMSVRHSDSCRYAVPAHVGTCERVVEG